MYIMSQDKKIIYDVRGLKVARNFGGKKDSKYTIIGKGNHLFSEDIILGFFPDEKNAIEELQNILTAIHNDEKTYSVK